jgi:hypothetical protein
MGIFNAPKAADPKTVADTQSQYNKQAAVDWTKMNAQSANRAGPFGSTTTQLDANGMPTGQTTSLDPSLNAGGVANAFGGQVNNLGTGQFDWDTMTAPAIAQGNMAAYGALTSPMRQQQQNALKTTLAERGIPLGSEIEQNEAGNLNRQFAIADQNAAAQAWNAVPGMQAQLQSNQIQQQMAPGAVAGQSLGLLGGLAGLTPGYTNIATQNFAPGDFAGAQARSDQQDMQNWQNTWNGIGNLAGVAGLGLLSPNLGQNFGKTLLGQGVNKLGGLFNG